MTYAVNWRGEGKTLKNPARWTAESGFTFGERYIPAGSVVLQFETRDFGYTKAVTPSGEHILARE